MLNVMRRIVIAIAALPLLLIVNISQSLASISSIKVAESHQDIWTQDFRQNSNSEVEADHLIAANLEQQFRLLGNNVEINATDPKAAVNNPDQLLQSELLLIAARNEKTRECRVSGLCS